MPFPRQNLPGMYATLGDAITHVAQGSGIETPGLAGLYAAPGQPVLDVELVCDHPVVRFPVDSWPALNRGDVLRVDLPAGTVVCVVREKPRRIADGTEAVVNLGYA